MRYFPIILVVMLLGMCICVLGVAADASSGNVSLTLVKQWESFRSPSDVAVDSHGNVYVADKYNHAVKVIDPNGNVRTISSGFNYPISIAVASNGNLYVGDTGNSNGETGAIKVIHADGMITTMKSGYDDPYIAVDSRDYVYVASTYQNGSNVVEVFYTNGTSRVLSDKFRDPHGIAVDRDGNVYVAHGTYFCGYSPRGIISEIYTNGTTRSMEFDFIPSEIAVDTNGNIYSGSFGYNYIYSSAYEIYANGTVRVLDKNFDKPNGVDVDSMGNVYVADTSNGLVKKISRNGTIQVLGSEFKKPCAITADLYGNVFVTDYAEHSIREILREGTVKTLSSNFTNPGCIAVDPYDNVYVVEYMPHSVQEIYANGTIRTFCNGNFREIAADPKGKIYAIDFIDVVEIGTNGTIRILNEEPIIGSLLSVAVDSKGNAYVADYTEKYGVKKIDLKGKVTTIGAEREFYDPHCVFVDSGDAVYVADTDHNLVKMITKKGVVKTFNRTFSHPYSVAVDTCGHMFVIDDNGLMEFSI